MKASLYLCRARCAGLLILGVVIAGCGPGGDTPKADDKAKAVTEAPKPLESPKAAAPAVVQPAPPAAPAAPLPPPPAASVPAPEPKPTVKAPAAKWVRLGTVQADFRKGRDRIVVGKSAGTFRELRIVVRDAPMEMHELTVTFGNDRQFKPKVKFLFNEKSTSGRIDLPGERRVIKHVDFVFRSPDRREGLATVVLQGR